MSTPRYRTVFRQSHKHIRRLYRGKQAAQIRQRACRASMYPNVMRPGPKASSQDREGPRSATDVLRPSRRGRCQFINALRGHLAEFGLVASKGPASLKLLKNALADESSDLPDPVLEMGEIYLEQIARLTDVIERLANALEDASKTDCELRRLCTIPGIGPVTAGAVAAFAPDLDTFDSGRNFAAWLGLVPRQRSTGARPGWRRSARWGRPISADCQSSER